MKRLFLLINVVAFSFTSCQKVEEIEKTPNGEYFPQGSNQPKIMSDDNLDFECYIQTAVEDFPNSIRSEMFIETISDEDFRFNSDNTREIVVEIYTTGQLTIGYLNEDLEVPDSELPEPFQTMEGRAYYAYVLFNDGWFYYCYIFIAGDGSSVCIRQPYNDGSGTGFEPIWSGLDMDDVCFNYLKSDIYINNENNVAHV